MTESERPPAMAGQVLERIPGSEAELEFIDMDRPDDPEQIRSRIALIRAHRGAAAMLVDAELRGTTKAYAAQDTEVQDEHQGHDLSEADGRGWAQ